MARRSNRSGSNSRLIRSAIMETLETRQFLSVNPAAAESVINPVLPPRQVEFLNRGVVAFKASIPPEAPLPPIGDIYVGWRMLGTDPQASTSFDLYCSTNGAAAVAIATNITASTNFVHTGQNYNDSHAYYVVPKLNGVTQPVSETYTLSAAATAKKHIDIPLEPPPAIALPNGQNSYTYNANDASVGDVDGDGQYEIILKWDPSNAQDSANNGYTGPVYIDCYRLDGTRLWRMNLGQNIRAGAHYTQHVVYDLDGDGRAEIAMRTAPGTIDGQGNAVLMDNDQVADDYRNSNGRINAGPEYLTIFDGLTGAALTTTAFTPDRVNVNTWGDTSGNRADRYLGGIAYLDGKRPSLIMMRGYYNARLTGNGEDVARNEVTAWNWRGGTLSQQWWFKAGFKTNDNINSDYIHGGGHNLFAADVDGDGRDEILSGAIVIDDNGDRLYTTGLGHSDALMVTDMNPNRPGQEVFAPHEVPGMYTQNGVAYGGDLHDAKTGELLLAIPGSGDVGRGNAFDIDPRFTGFEMWTSADGGIWNATGARVQDKPTNMFQNMGIWWDADPLRELEDGTTISDWVINPSTGIGGRSNLVSATGNGSLNDSTGLSSNNGTKSTPSLIADIFGDWREEIIWRQSNNLALQIWSTTIPANNRTYTLMHDVQYRESVAFQQTGYNQPTATSFYLGAVESTGTQMPTIPSPNIYVANGVVPASPPVPTGLSNTALPPQGVNLTWNAVPGATAYRVRRGISGSPAVTVAFVDSNSFTDTNLPPGQTYYYTVSAISATGESNNSFLTSRQISGTQTNYQAELGTIAGGSAVNNTGSGFAGTGWVGFPANGGSLELNNINGGPGGMARINIRFSQSYVGNSTDPGRAGWLYINGVRQVINTRFTGSENAAWTSYVVNANLNPGLNTLRIESTGQDMGNIDEIQVTVPPDTIPPRLVGNLTYGYDTLPHTLSFTFSESVEASLTSADLVLDQIDATGNVIANIAVTLASYNPATNTALFHLNNSTILPDGNFRATLNAGSVTDLAGNLLAGTNRYYFFFYQGDINHDRTVNVLDQYFVGINWQATGATYLMGDINYDGVVNDADLGIIGTKWLTTLPDLSLPPTGPIYVGPPASNVPAPASTPTTTVALKRVAVRKLERPINQLLVPTTPGVL